jgi:hypothetical protein
MAFFALEFLVLRAPFFTPPFVGLALEAVPVLVVVGAIADGLAMELVKWK